MNKQMIISVMSRDRTGLIADVTGAIYALNGDLADLNQSVLGGYLTMILIASFDESVTPEDVLAEFSHLPSSTKIDALVRVMETPIEIAKANMPVETYVLTAQGQNRSGLVHGLSKFCADRHINILDLTTTLADDQYTMVLQIDLDQVASIKDIREDLENFSQESGLRVMMQHNDIFHATHEITL